MAATACQIVPTARPAPTSGVASGAGVFLRGLDAPDAPRDGARLALLRVPGLRAGGRLRVPVVPATGRP
jgi:hypothetical protein